jgi:hypothetical protein
MSPVIWLVVAGALMPVTGYALIGGLRAVRWLSESRRQAPPPVPAERLTANLRRLRAQLEQTEESPGLTAKRHHVAAVRAAYLDVLAEACGRAGIDPPGDRATQADIYRTEAALAAHGFAVRDRVAGGGAR